MEWSVENASRYIEIYEAIQSSDMQKLKEKLHDQHKNLNYAGLDLGFIYHSQAIFSENAQKLSVTPSKYIPTSLPGSRAPHLKLIKNGMEISTLDLFEKEFVLLIGSEGEPWKKAAAEVAETLSFPLKGYKIAKDGDLYDPDDNWHTTYGMTKTGAVLVRPDGHVVWRSLSRISEPKALLHKIINRLLT